LGEINGLDKPSIQPLGLADVGIEIGKALDLDQASSHCAARRLLMVCAFCQAPRLGTG
jgi:hypothetical protein